MRKQLLLSTAIFMVAAGTTDALAQAAPASTGIEEITVTAQRRAQGEEHAAVALSVIQGSAITEAGIVSPDRLQQLVPALTVEPTSTGNILFIRGVGNFTVVPNSDPAIAFNYDGVYIGRPTSTSGIFYDLDRVEVLKGPQGILYGRNATGGAINVLPTQPQIGDDLSGDANVSYGNYNTIVAQAAVNIPVTDTSAFRIAASESYHDGYLKDGADDDDTTSARLQYKNEITPNLTLRIAADYSHTGGTGQGVSYLNYWTCPLNPSAAAVGSQAGACAIADSSHINLDQGVLTPASQAYRITHPVGGPVPAANLTPLTPGPSVDNSFYGANAEVSYDTGFGVLTVIPAWREAKLNLQADAAAFGAGDVETDEQTSAEIRFAGKRISIFDYTIGFYDYNEDIKSAENINLSAQGAWVRDHLKTDSYAPFGELTANISDTFRLVSGIRYTHDKKTLNGDAIGMTLVCPLGPPLGANCPQYVIPYSNSYAGLPASYIAGLPGGVLPALGTPLAPVITHLPEGLPFIPSMLETTDNVQNLAATNTRVTYREAVEWDVTPTSMAYASLETGYRSGGFNSSYTYPTYKPEYIDAYTIGIKNRLFDNQLQLNVEAFDWKYENQQVNHVSLDPTTNSPANFTSNVGESRIKGAEVDAIALITPTTLLTADIQYLDATYDHYVYSAAYTVTPFGVTSPLTGCPAYKTVAPAPAPAGTYVWNIDCSGRPSYNSPKWTINLALQQTFNLDALHLPTDQLVFTADTQYKSMYDNGFAYLSDEVVRPTWTSDAQIEFEPVDERWSIAAYVRNIENNQTPEFSTFHPLAQLSEATISSPRTYGVRFSLKF
jgi:iron complex outermembrane receptor protein